MKSLADPSLRDEVVGVYSRAMRAVWLVGIALAGVGFLVTFLEKEVKLRESLNTEFGMEVEKKEHEGTQSSRPVEIAASAVPTTREAGPP